MPKKPINHYEHTDKGTNNPTQELSGFAEEEEYAPTLYPRDTALDPQLVWKGKDQQNDTDLEVPAVPICSDSRKNCCPTASDSRESLAVGCVLACR